MQADSDEVLKRGTYNRVSLKDGKYRLVVVSYGPTPYNYAYSRMFWQDIKNSGSGTWGTSYFYVSSGKFYYNPGAFFIP